MKEGTRFNKETKKFETKEEGKEEEMDARGDNTDKNIKSMQRSHEWNQ